MGSRGRYRIGFFLTCVSFLAAACSTIPNAMGAKHKPPPVAWEFAAQSNLYAAPLVADMNPSPGLETVISDSEARRLRCIDARGKQLWEFDGGWKLRLTSGASYSAMARPGQGTLVVGNADGTLWCVDAATGTGIWKQAIGDIEWGSAVWADLDGDGRDDIIAGTESSGIHALKADGTAIWVYPKAGDPAISVGCPIAVSDVERDGRPEVFVLDHHGPLCLNADGTLRWRAELSYEFVGAPVVADADGDGIPELYCVASKSNALFSFNALTGVLNWKMTLLAEPDVYSGASLAVGDLDGDGKAEIVFADKFGHVYAVGCDGHLRWVFETEKPVHASVSLGDVDGDGNVDVLVGSGDHYLYRLNGAGVLEWRLETGMRIVHPASITDVDRDGRVDILVCSSDTKLRCLKLDTRYNPDRIPWPMQRFDVAGSGSNWPSFVGSHAKNSRGALGTVALPAKVQVQNKRIKNSDAVTSREPLFSDGGFERPEVKPATPGDTSHSAPTKQGRLPTGWVVESISGVTLSNDPATHRSGNASGLVLTAGHEAVIATEPIVIEAGVQSIDAEIFTQASAQASATLRWIGHTGVLREDPLYLKLAGSGWNALQISGDTPPPDACWLQLVCTSGPGSTNWDDATISASVARRKELRALVNQVGYEVGAPKGITAQANFNAEKGSFDLVDATGRCVFTCELESKGRIVGAYDHDWGHTYWRGDFSDFNTPGRYRIRVHIGGLTNVSYPFEIGGNLLWEKTSHLAYRFFYYQRCGTAVPGFHEACHLDDAASPDGARQHPLAGGWHDAGDYNKYNNAPYVFGLAQAFERQPARFGNQDEDHNGRADFLDEINWGGDCSRRMIAPDGSAFGGITSGYAFWGPPNMETDNIPGTGDDRRIGGDKSGNDSGMNLAAVAKLARLDGADGPLLEAAERAYAWHAKRGTKDALQLSAALDLYAVTQKESYAADARTMFPNIGMDNVSIVQRYDLAFREDHNAQIRATAVTRADQYLTLADNPFGVCAISIVGADAGHPRYNYFGTPRDEGGWHVGNSSHVLEAATWAATAYQYTKDSRYLVFVYDQLNWLLGNNPYDCCLMEGAGSKNLPSYHNRIRFAGVLRGAVPGGIPNGVTWRAPGDDRPYLDMRGVDIPDFEPNEVWLPHNTNYLSALTSLVTARDAIEK